LKKDSHPADGSSFSSWFKKRKKGKKRERKKKTQHTTYYYETREIDDGRKCEGLNKDQLLEVKKKKGDQDSKLSKEEKASRFPERGIGGTISFKRETKEEKCSSTLCSLGRREVIWCHPKR